ncbi:ATP-binding protein [Candidatus Puniceispirillum sp.]|nr:ATP-binding protein [Candidatus Puniceispirillum sp.]
MIKSDDITPLLSQLTRIADALERQFPRNMAFDALKKADAYVWQSDIRRLVSVNCVNRLDIELLKGINEQRNDLLTNTLGFVAGFSANNALLWGARGTGKSSLVKAVHGTVIDRGFDLGLVEIHREDISDLPYLMSFLAKIDRYFIIFSDDLAFESGESTYKSLKAALEGGIEGRPDNIIFYATSNRRHLMPRQMIENERSTAINPSETTEETVSLSDRFGLWIGFHSIDQDTYLEMVDGYIKFYNIKTGSIDVRQEALAWSIGRGSRSGRVAWQFITDLAARSKISLRC